MPNKQNYIAISSTQLQDLYSLCSSHRFWIAFESLQSISYNRRKKAELTHKSGRKQQLLYMQWNLQVRQRLHGDNVNSTILPFVEWLSSFSRGSQCDKPIQESNFGTMINALYTSLYGEVYYTVSLLWRAHYQWFLCSQSVVKLLSCMDVSINYLVPEKYSLRMFKVYCEYSENTTNLDIARS